MRRDSGSIYRKARDGFIFLLENNPQPFARCGLYFKKKQKTPRRNNEVETILSVRETFVER